MTDRELMQQALDALCQSSIPAYGYRRNELRLTPKPHIELYQEAIEALRARLAQPEPYKQPEDNRLLMQAYRAIHEKQPEPVAWQVHPFDYGIGPEGVYARTDRLEQVEMWKRKGWTVQPLYTAPPQREWQGLTDEEEAELDEKYGSGDINIYIDQRDLKLREKNT